MIRCLGALTGTQGHAEALVRRFEARPGWGDIPAVAAGRIVEIKSPLILQPGPAALTDGLDAIVAALWDEGARP